MGPNHRYAHPYRFALHVITYRVFLYPRFSFSLERRPRMKKCPMSLLITKGGQKIIGQVINFGIVRLCLGVIGELVTFVTKNSGQMSLVDRR